MPARKKKRRKAGTRERKKPLWAGAARLRKEREARGWSLSVLSGEIYAATRVALDRQRLHNYEHGTEPVVTAFLAICKTFEIDPWEFLP